MKMKKAVSLLLSVFLVLGALTGCSDDNSAGSMSSFTANTLDGGTFTQDDIKSKDLTIVNFWGMFCLPCRAEMPDLAAYAKALPENVQLITACIDGSNDLDATRDFLKNAGFEGVTLLSGDGDFDDLFASIQAFPTTVFVNSQGKIVGEPIIGGQANLAEVYTAAVNRALKAEGKAEISVEVQ